MKLLWNKLDPRAKIPQKAHKEDLGFDLYAIDLPISVMPGETVMLHTGLRSIFDTSYGAIVKERGSSPLHIRAGVVEGNYRGEWIIKMTNTANKPVLFKEDINKGYEDDEFIYYPSTKAVAQIIFIKNHEVESVEIFDDTWQHHVDSEINVRGEGGFGSSGK